MHQFATFAEDKDKFMLPDSSPHPTLCSNYITRTFASSLVMNTLF